MTAHVDAHGDQCGAGVKIAVVINVGTATLGALIGAGGYGSGPGRIEVRPQP